jgi:beta-glucosidase
VDYDEGDDIPRAVEAAKGADAVIVFAHQWAGEMFDLPDLALPDGQDRLIEAVAAANPRTVVVLETGGPVLMPWLPLTAAVIEAWYPGARGGEAIARILFGEVNPSGRLPMTFPADEAQLPRAKIAKESGGKDDGGQPPEVVYFEGARVGYKWFDKSAAKPLFPFGYGLSYTSFGYTGLTAGASGSSMTISVDVRNAGPRPGADIPQFYLRRPADAEFPVRLVGWSKVSLEPGETRRVTLTVDPRLLAHFDAASGGWEIAPGRYTVEAGANAGELPLKAEVTLVSARLSTTP